ncbi:major facilitator superfamily protein [Hirsutella rhossiliensis]|uniref:Major facilitator superfamily domain-containing protein n=1 Tax=Hirsutella rhossiliensis TaxID=111463 RepID=A0A9P8MZV9_9HYPO|nr:major facilitator superfamily domain-containing protein [Hirsutella rhossiliensis]KAH0963326.1 major facilitator superfamily domain-containing protein [Hirsutella rhossiliensis]
MASALRRPVQWLCHEFGVASVYTTGPDTWLVIFSRTCRMFAFGAISLIIALFLSALGFSDFRIGLFMTLTLAGDVVLSLATALVADRIGRRRILLLGGSLMVLSGAVFAYFENFWILLGAAVVGVVSATGGDFGPFRSVEESTLSHLTTPSTRSDVLSWYVTTSTLGSAVGTELAGRAVDYLLRFNGRSIINAYHAMFGIYVAMGALTIVSTLLMSKRCEADESSEQDAMASEPLLGEEPNAEGSNECHNADGSPPASPATPPEESPRDQSSPEPQSRLARMWRLWILLTIDSLADGMVSYALTNYYLARKFDLSESYRGDIMSISYLLMSISTIFAAPLARHLGLINTMVFTHLPSSAAVLLFPIPQSVGMTITLLFVRTGLNNMDQAPRAAFIAAAVRPEERTAVMGITGLLRTLASTIGPSLTGFLAGTDRFWIAFVIAGALRIGYDLGLFFLFVGLKLHALEPAEDQAYDPTRSDEETTSAEAVDGGRAALARD